MTISGIGSRHKFEKHIHAKSQNNQNSNSDNNNKLTDNIDFVALEQFTDRNDGTIMGFSISSSSPEGPTVDARNLATS